MKQYTERAIRIALSLTEGSVLEVYSCLVLSASSRLYWKRFAPVGSDLRDYKQLVMPTDPLTFMVGHCNKTHVILTSAFGAPTGSVSSLPSESVSTA